MQLEPNGLRSGDVAIYKAYFLGLCKVISPGIPTDKIRDVVLDVFQFYDYATGPKIIHLGFWQGRSDCVCPATSTAEKSQWKSFKMEDPGDHRF